jgi:hypothetical protein
MSLWFNKEFNNADDIPKATSSAKIISLSKPKIKKNNNIEVEKEEKVQKKKNSKFMKI